MSQRTITRLYDTREHAVAAISDLEAAGFSHDDLGIVATNPDNTTYTDTTPHHDRAETKSGTGIGAALGTFLGGGAGLAAALGAIAIPGIGPLVAAGALATTLVGAGTGAVAGGLVGSLTGHGVHESEAPVYAEGMRRGGSLVTARVDESRAAEVEAILSRHSPVDIAAREADYRASGWSGYDDDAPINTSGRTQRSGLNDPLIPGGPFNDRQI
jgi:hypothetical protein